MVVEAAEILDASARCMKDEKESVEAAAAEALVEDKDMVATADNRAESAPWESTIVVMQEEFGSGGNLTRVIKPGTTSEKYRDTKVDMSDDLPTPSFHIKIKEKMGVRCSWNYLKDKGIRCQNANRIYTRNSFSNT